MRTCIIGAGPSGLVTLKELREKNISATIYEAGSRISGSFATVYPGAMMTSSSILTVFSSFADAALSPTMWTCEEYVSYLERFTQKFQLSPDIQFDTLIQDVRRLEDGRWQVTSSSNRATAVELFDAIAVTTGLNQTPNIPEWAQPSPRASPKITHSANVRSFEQFRNKNVVLVGLGESGSDMSLTIGKIAKSLKISTRSNGSGFVIPRFIAGELTDLNTNRVNSGVWGPSDYKGFVTTLKKAIEQSDMALLQKLARLWNGTDNLSEVDIATILWNDAYNAHAYDRFGTKNVSFIESIHSHNAVIIPEIKSFSDLPPNTDEVTLCTGYITAFPFLSSALTPHLHRERA